MISKFTKLQIRICIKDLLKTSERERRDYKIDFLRGFFTALMFEDKISIATKNRYIRLVYKLDSGMISLK